MPPPLSSLRGRPSASRAAEQTQRSSSFPHPIHLTVTAAPASRVQAALSKAARWPSPFDLETDVRVTCDVGYLCANFTLPRPLCSRLRPDVRDRQTDRCQTDRRQTKASGIINRLSLSLAQVIKTMRVQREQ